MQEGFEEEAVLPLARMVYGEVGQSYVALARPEGATLVGKFTNVLKFTVKEIDPTTGLLHSHTQPAKLLSSNAVLCWAVLHSAQPLPAAP